ncbi:phytoene/squalene synthase family protein [Bacillus tianshenii]|nr:phytoene/squalene synthase family protein [Bacillus tianshenii]
MVKKIETSDAWRVLEETSRTFVIPIRRLQGDLQTAVMASYLCMRAIDEIEDHPELEPGLKINLLQRVADGIQENKSFSKLFAPYADRLPEVTLLLDEWLKLLPAAVLSKVGAFVSEMASGMAKWTEKNWKIETVDDLDDYTYYVAGLVGVMLSELWIWYDGTKTKKDLAIAFGRGLQLVNILRNKQEDEERGVSFYPNQWGKPELTTYALTQLRKAEEYIKSIKTKSIREFCEIPLLLAFATINTMEAQKEKLSREEVLGVVDSVIAKNA